jgi:hypothetical protein
MYRKLLLCLCVILFSAVMATAQDVNKDKVMGTAHDADKDKVMAATNDVVEEADEDEVTATTHDADKDKDEDEVMATAQGTDKDKELSGMSIVGNDEAPKSLYIVPWKSSEIGAETSLDMMLTEGDVPVDRDVFKRQLEFYRVSKAKQ